MLEDRNGEIIHVKLLSPLKHKILELIYYYYHHYNSIYVPLNVKTKTLGTSLNLLEAFPLLDLSFLKFVQIFLLNLL